MTKIKLTGRFNDPDDFFDTEWNRDLFKEVDLDWDKFTPEQREVILMPVEAPENFMQDGEISLGYAIRLQNNRLVQADINGSDRAKALKLCH